MNLIWMKWRNRSKGCFWYNLINVFQHFDSSFNKFIGISQKWIVFILFNLQSSVLSTSGGLVNFTRICTKKCYTTDNLLKWSNNTVDWSWSDIAMVISCRAYLHWITTKYFIVNIAQSRLSLKPSLGLPHFQTECHYYPPVVSAKAQKGNLWQY